MKKSLLTTLNQRIKKTLHHKIGDTKSLLQPKALNDLMTNQIGDRKTILITGASSGIGAGMALVFAKLGYNLALCARRIERLEALKLTILSINPKAQVVVKALDVMDYETVSEGFQAFQQELGVIDRIVVNAGSGDGRRVGTGRFHINRHTAEINFIAALAQCEAAMEIFRAQNFGHLVVISSMSAMRGMPKHLTVYAASKAALAHLAEGIRAEMIADHLPIDVTTIYPGYIRTEMNEGAAKLPFEVDTETGSNAIVAAIESGVAEACVPTLPWLFVGKAMKHMPLHLVNKFS